MSKPLRCWAWLNVPRSETGLTPEPGFTRNCKTRLIQVSWPHSNPEIGLTNSWWNFRSTAGSDRATGAARAAECAWSAKTPLPTARFGLTTCVVDGKIYALGGGITPDDAYLS